MGMDIVTFCMVTLWHKFVCLATIQTKIQSGDLVLMEEGCHGLWELSINRDNHADIGIEQMAVLLAMLDEVDVKVGVSLNDSYDSAHLMDCSLLLGIR